MERKYNGEITPSTTRATTRNLLEGVCTYGSKPKEQMNKIPVRIGRV
jgi:hypothetical protein